MEALTEQQITKALEDLPGWEYDGEAITKTYSLDSFREAIDFVDDVADLAEESNHHPDIEIYYDEVVISYRTHSADAVTERDVQMAGEVETLLAEDEDYDEYEFEENDE